MGVKGLLPCLQSITRSVSLEHYRGLTVAVDAMSWLHKGVFACDVKALAKSQRENGSYEKPTSAESKCINFTIKKAEALRAKFDIEVILVIDGDSLPSKKEENAQRREERDKAFEKAAVAEKARDSRTARRFYAQSCSVTHEIRYELIKACKSLGISFVVAPYEADAQMARLAHTGIVDLVITEDSDILVYGCPRALFKVDFETYRGQEIQLMKDLGENVTPSFRNWTHDMFVFMCIISGCDYCKGVSGIGIKLAHKLVRVHRSPSKIFSALRAAGRMTPEFEEKFWIAFRTFRHQRVFCSSKQKIETLWPIAGSNYEASPNDVWPFLGEYVEPRLACGVADGTLHPSKKIRWNEALKSQTGNETMLSSDGVHIHRRSLASDQGQDRRGPNGKSNVWHSLVYGTKDDNRHGRQADENGNEHHHSTKNECSKRDMFSFFPQNKKLGNEDTKEGRDVLASDDMDYPKIRPPLQEIYVGTDSTSQSKSTYIQPAHHKDVPIHFHEYSSQLVGKTFKPISRKRRKQETDGTKSSKYVQKIWEKCLDVQGCAKKEHKSMEDSETRKEIEGVSLFQKKISKVVISDSCGYGIESRTDQDYFHIDTGKTYRDGIAQHQHDKDRGLSMNQYVCCDDSKQDSYHSHLNAAETYEDRSVRLSNTLSSHQRVEGHQKWYPEDFSSSATTCEDISRFETDSHAHHLPQTVEAYIDSLPQHHLDPGHIASEDPESQGFRDPDFNFNDTKSDSYSYQIIQNEYRIKEDREVFNLLKTTKKNHRDFSCDNGMNGVDGDLDVSYNATRSDLYRGSAPELYNCQNTHDDYGLEEESEVFNLLKTAKKEPQDYMDHVDPTSRVHSGSNDLRYYYVDHTDPGPGYSHDSTRTDSYHCQTSHGEYGTEEENEVFNLLKTIKKRRPNSSDHSCMDHGQQVGHHECVSSRADYQSGNLPFHGQHQLSLLESDDLHGYDFVGGENSLAGLEDGPFNF